MSVPPTCPAEPITVPAGFDEFNPDIEPSCDGDMIELSDRRPSNGKIRDPEDGLRRLAGFMPTRDADRAQSRRVGEMGVVQFHIGH
jgi:hypothetical protein